MIRLLLCVGLSLGCAIDRSGLDVQNDASRDAESDAPSVDVGTDVDEDAGCTTDRDGDSVVDCLDGCPDDPLKTEPMVCGCGVPDEDADTDGSLVCNDCDDTDPAQFPGNPELCDGRDNDCNGSVDDGVDCAEAGCADGSREGFVDTERYPGIAACAGAWSIPGLDVGAPACERQAGNDGARADGSGCNVEDLCATNWHVCVSPAEVGSLAPDGCGAATSDPDTFFLQRTSSAGRGVCDGGADDLFGCGMVDTSSVPQDMCGLLNARTCCSCRDLRDEGWACGTGSGNTNEASEVTKSDPTQGGGVLCCHD